MEAKKIIIYDFDGTLTPYSIPRFEMLKKCMGDARGIKKFYLDVMKRSFVKKNDFYRAFYEVYFEEIKRCGLEINDDNLCLGSDRVVYNAGVYEFLFDLKRNNIKNYLLSSNVKVFLDKTLIAELFEQVYATTFNYDAGGKVEGINHLISSFGKVEIIKEILALNSYAIDDCSDVIYVGDGITDVYAMEYVKKNGGISILLYSDLKTKNIKRIMKKNAVNILIPADFSFDGNLSGYIKKLCKIRKLNGISD